MQPILDVKINLPSAPFKFTPQLSSPDELFEHLLLIAHHLCPMEGDIGPITFERTEVEPSALPTIDHYASTIKQMTEPMPSIYHKRRCYKITSQHNPIMTQTTLILRIYHFGQYWIPFQIVRQAKTTTNYGIIQVLAKDGYNCYQSSLSTNLEKDVMVIANDFDINSREIKYRYATYFNSVEMFSCYTNYVNNTTIKTSLDGFIFDYDTQGWPSSTKFYDDDIIETITANDRLALDNSIITMLVKHQFGSSYNVYRAAYTIFPAHHPCVEMHGSWSFVFLSNARCGSRATYLQDYHSGVCKKQTIIRGGDFYQVDEFDKHNLTSRTIVHNDDNKHEAYDKFARIIDRQIVSNSAKLTIKYTYDL